MMGERVAQFFLKVGTCMGPDALDDLLIALQLRRNDGLSPFGLTEFEDVA